MDQRTTKGEFVMRKDNMEQRSAEELTTEELEHVSAAAAGPTWYSPIDDTKSYPRDD
jgi:hypothetical protein